MLALRGYFYGFFAPPPSWKKRCAFSYFGDGGGDIPGIQVMPGMGHWPSRSNLNLDCCSALNKVPLNYLSKFTLGF